MQVVEAQPDMPLDGSISLYVALLTFVLSVYSDQLEYVNHVLVYVDHLANLIEDFLVTA